MILLGVLAVIASIVQKQKLRKEQEEFEEENSAYDSSVNQFDTNDSSSKGSETSFSSDNSASVDPPRPMKKRAPDFEYSGEVNEDGWEVCEYPDGSNVWWWKDYETETWVLWSDDSEDSDTSSKVQESEIKQHPEFEYSGEVNEDGWEVCEYPRGSKVWWWKDYDSKAWVLWNKEQTNETQTRPESKTTTNTSETKLSIKLVQKNWFPKISLTVNFKDPLHGINEQLSFSTWARTYSVKLANGFQVGTLSLGGLTVFSGAEGMITFSNGQRYNAKLITGPLGPKGLTITDWDDGRRYMITF